MQRRLDPLASQLETATQPFRELMARRHRKTRREAHLEAVAGLERWDPTAAPSERAKVVAEVREAVSRKHWHAHRDDGQRWRFRRLALCGSRHVVASCTNCEAERKPRPEGCGVARLCSRCATENAKKRRARFGAARQRVWLQLSRVGFTRGGSTAPGGTWGDKMVTLTVPHFDLKDVEADAEFLDVGATRAASTVAARIFAIRAAWPIFARSLRDWFARGGDGPRRTKAARYAPRRRPIAVPLPSGKYAPPALHRAFEWTPGRDGLGHPHFHVWLCAPFLPVDVVGRLWSLALLAVGAPLPTTGARVWVQAFRDFDGRASDELVKNGSRRALEFSRLYFDGPKNAFTYADGWTMAEAMRPREGKPPPVDVLAELYKALEGFRLTQGSAGLFLEDAKLICPSCCAPHVEGRAAWRIRFECAPDPDEAERDPERAAIEAEAPP